MRFLLLAAALLAAPLTQAQSLRASGPATPLAGTADAPLAHALWSPTGDAVAASRPDHDGLWLVAPDGGQSQLFDGIAYAPEWSPDGGALLFRATRLDGVRREHAVAVLDLASGETTMLSDWRGSMPTLPRWSADGTQALLLDASGDVDRFPTGREPVAARASASGPAFLLAESGTVAADAADARPLAPLGDTRLLNLTPSPDRQRLAFEAMGGNLYVANADGSELVDLGAGHRPTWSPDGRWVAFMRTEDDGHALLAADLWAARADGSETVRLTDFSGLEMNPSWSPDGQRIAFDDGQTVYLLPVSE